VAYSNRLHLAPYAIGTRSRVIIHIFRLEPGGLDYMTGDSSFLPRDAL